MKPPESIKPVWIVLAIIVVVGLVIFAGKQALGGGQPVQVPEKLGPPPGPRSGS